MATQEDIDKVKDNLNPTAAAEGWDDTKIGQLLDEGNTVDEVTLEYWESRLARVSTLVNVSENGSSRSLGGVFDNALKMAQYFKDKTGTEDTAETKRAVTTRAIRRV